eukprot:scaffold668_cov385-Prasinococcus_capsulatus_cf.AAC.1
MRASTSPFGHRCVATAAPSGGWHALLKSGLGRREPRSTPGRQFAPSFATDYRSSHASRRMLSVTRMSGRGRSPAAACDRGRPILAAPG